MLKDFLAGLESLAHSQRTRLTCLKVWVPSLVLKKKIPLPIENTSCCSVVILLVLKVHLSFQRRPLPNLLQLSHGSCHMAAVTWQLSRGRFHRLLSRGKHAQHCYGMAVRFSLPSASWLNVLASWCVYTFPFSIHLATHASVILPIHESIRYHTYIRTRWEEIHIKWNSH